MARWRLEHRLQCCDFEALCKSTDESAGKAAEADGPCYFWDMPPLMTAGMMERAVPHFLLGELRALGVLPADENAPLCRKHALAAQCLPLVAGGHDVCFSSLVEDYPLAARTLQDGRSMIALAMCCVVWHVNHQPVLEPFEGPIALVLCPTQDLCGAAAAMCELFGQHTRVTSHSLFTPFPAMPQHMRAEIVICTPPQWRLLFSHDLSSVSSTELPYSCRFISCVVLLGVQQLIQDHGFGADVLDALRQTLPNAQKIIVSSHSQLEGSTVEYSWLREVALGASTVVVGPARDTSQAVSAATLDLDVSFTIHPDEEAKATKRQRTDSGSSEQAPSSLHPTNSIVVFNVLQRGEEEDPELIAEFSEGMRAYGTLASPVTSLLMSPVVSYHFSDRKLKGSCIVSIAASHSRGLLLNYTSASEALRAFGSTHGRVFDGRRLCVAFAPRDYHGGLWPIDVAWTSTAHVPLPSCQQLMQPVLQRVVSSFLCSVVMLRNVVSRVSELCQIDSSVSATQTLLEDITEECRLFGDVVDVKYWARDKSAAAPTPQQCSPIDDVRVAVKFFSFVNACEAIVALDGRSFNGRRAFADLFDDDRFNNDDFSPKYDTGAERMRFTAAEDAELLELL